MSRVKQLYPQRLAAGLLLPDPAQAEAVERLDALAKALAGARGWLGGGSARGLYIWGGGRPGQVHADGPVLRGGAA